MERKLLCAMSSGIERVGDEYAVVGLRRSLLKRFYATWASRCFQLSRVSCQAFIGVIETWLVVGCFVQP